MAEKPFEKRLLDLIPFGEENAVKARELAKLMNCHTRIITASIHFLRCTGAVICADSNGFYKPASRAETEHFVQSMRSRCRHIKAAAASAEKLLKKGVSGCE